MSFETSEHVSYVIESISFNYLCGCPSFQILSSASLLACELPFSPLKIPMKLKPRLFQMLAVGRAFRVSPLSPLLEGFSLL